MGNSVEVLSRSRITVIRFESNGRITGLEPHVKYYKLLVFIDINRPSNRQGPVKKNKKPVKQSELCCVTNKEAGVCKILMCCVSMGLDQFQQAALRRCYITAAIVVTALGQASAVVIR